MARVTSYGVEKDQKIYGNCQVLSSDGILILDVIIRLQTSNHIHKSSTKGSNIDKIIDLDTEWNKMMDTLDKEIEKKSVCRKEKIKRLFD
jgi:hypothetical protein